jgi:hypothetical protein
MSSSPTRDFRRESGTIRSVGGHRTIAIAVLAALVVSLVGASGAAADDPKPKPAPTNSASGQYGKKVAVCSVTVLGKQRTILVLSKGVPAYLGTHPKAYSGACSKPRRAKPNICIRLTPRKLVPVWVPTHFEKAYLKRNIGSFKTKTGKCVLRRTASRHEKRPARPDPASTGRRV